MPKPPSSLGWRVIPLMGLSVVLLNLNRNAVHVFTQTEDVFNADSHVIASARNQSSSSSSSSWNASGSFPSSDPLLVGDNNATAAAVVQLTPSLNKSVGNDSSIAAAATAGAAVVGVPNQVMTPPSSSSSSLPVPPADWRVNGTCAIVYVIGGIKPPDRNGTGTGYHGYLYTIMMNTHVMRATGSTADVVVWLQLSSDSDDHELPAADAHLLRLYNIDIRYMPKDRHEDFITIQLEKFRILTMTEYQRVLYLDGDVIVRASLDYLFWYSLQGVFEENVVLSGIMEPSNGGTFMLTPHAGDYERIQNIILATATRNAQLPYPHFDPDVGWGHAIVPPDHFDLADTFNITRWDFFAAQTDQGLLFYWTKYIQQSVTYLIRNFARNWRVDGNGTLRQYREMDVRDLLASLHGVVPPTQCWPGQTRIVQASCVPPHAHFQHMTGTSKPWMSGPPPSLPANRSLAANGREFWFANLVELNNMHNLGINFTNWQHTDRPRHGLFAGQPIIVARVQRIAAAAASAAAAAAANNATTAASASDALSPQPPVAPPNPTNATAVAQVNNATTRLLLADALLPKPPRNLNVSSTCAYVYVIGGINPGDNRGSSYHGYLYTIVMNTFNMRETGSTADVVVWLQLSHACTHDTLPAADVKMLQLFNIQIRYIPKDPYESFVTIIMEKFRILQMTEYQRVMFLDGDVVVRASLDYLFWYSLEGIFEENVVVTGLREPANAGIFILTPQPRDWEQIQQIMVETAQRNAKLPYPHFDQEVGWGVKIESPDYYQTAKIKEGTLWNWHGVQADQGLLFYWTKYVKKAVTYLIYSYARNWHEMEDGTVRQHQQITLRELFGDQDAVPRRSCWRDQTRIVMSECVPPHSDYQHLTGSSKPWLSVPPTPIPTNRTFATNGREFWWAALHELNDMYHLDINFTNWNYNRRPKLGLFFGTKQAASRVKRMATTAANISNAVAA